LKNGAFDGVDSVWMTQPWCWWQQCWILIVCGVAVRCAMMSCTHLYTVINITHTRAVLTDDWSFAFRSLFFCIVFLIAQFAVGLVVCVCIFCVYSVCICWVVWSPVPVSLQLKCTSMTWLVVCGRWTLLAYLLREQVRVGFNGRMSLRLSHATLCSPRPLYVLFRYLFHKRWFDNKCRGRLAGWMSPNQQCQRTTDSWWWNSLV